MTERATERGTGGRIEGATGGATGGGAQGVGTPAPGHLATGGDPGDRRSEIGHLLARLGAPLRSSANGGTAPPMRLLAQVPPLGLASALLEEIDATVMARCLVFRSANGLRLDLEVSNRRLLHFRAVARADPGHVDDAGTGPPDPELVEESGPLAYAGVADLSRFAGCVSRLTRTAPVTVEARPPTGAVSGEEAGVSVSILRRALGATGPARAEVMAPDTAPESAAVVARPSGAGRGVSADSGARPDAEDDSPKDRPGAHAALLTDYVAAAGAATRAWRLLTGPSGGDPALVDRLGPMLEEWCSLGFAPPGETHATVLTPSSPDALPVFFGQTDDDVLALALHPGTEERAIALWLALVAPGASAQIDQR